MSKFDRNFNINEDGNNFVNYIQSLEFRYNFLNVFDDRYRGAD